MEFITREKAENYTGEFLKFEITQKTFEEKLNMYKKLLQIEGMDFHKVKTVFVEDNKQNITCIYTKPNVETYVEIFENYQDIDEIKVKGFIESAKISILINFVDKYIQIKSDYNEKFNFENIENIINILN